MKRLLPVCLLACALSGATHAVTIWQEDFSSYTNVGITGLGATNYPSGTTNWTIDVSACATLTPGGGAGDYFMAVSTSDGRMEAVNVDGEAIWSSVVINIGDYTNVSLSVATSETGSSASTNKYVKLFYRLDNGAETAFAVNPESVGNWGSSIASKSNLYGSTIQIIARVNNPNTSDKSIFDDVSISGDSAAVNLPPVLDSISNYAVLEQETLSFTVTASDSVDDDSITLSAINLPTGAVFINGTFVWSSAVPSGVYAVTFYATDKDGSASETVTITVLPRPRLFISEIADPAGTYADAYRFVEIYNAGTNSVNLASNRWTLSCQKNGIDWSDVSLTGAVAAAGTYVIAKSRTDFFAAYGFYPQQGSPVVDGNGNDSYVLYYGGSHTNGVRIDVYGQPDIDGTGTQWEYTDSRATRKTGILQPNSNWTAAEWIITAGATTAAMTPGQHGPVPEFQDLENPFVFTGDSLSLIVTAVNTVRTDVITLSATALPGNATFTTATGTNTVSSALNWSRPTSGTYTATFAASGFSGTNFAALTITVSSNSKISGYFYGWSGDTIFKLDNGQFWKQSVSTSKTFPAIYHPLITITNYLSYERRMYITNGTSFVVVAPLTVTESTVTNTFTGLQYQNIYQLSDGTAWQQISFDTASSNPASVTAWRWMESGQQKMRFFGRNNVVIGTCTVEASAPPTDTTIHSQIDGWFRGWQNKRVFALRNGQFWQQTSLTSSIEALSSPNVTITNWLQQGFWRMSIDSLSGYVEVRQISATRTTIAGNFFGLGLRNLFKLSNGQWWQQTSPDRSVSEHANPPVIIWNEDGTGWLELPDQGLRAAAKELNVYQEGTVTNTFTGLHYGNLYRLNGAGDWMQVSFENISTNASAPGVMLWTEGTQTNMIVRDSRDVAIGTCTVVDPVIDSDHDGFSNAAEMLAGFDPLDSESRFELHQTDHYILSWEAAEGRLYTIEWTPSLSEPFQPLETSIVWPQNSWTDTVHSVATEGFYRISVRLAE